MITVGEGVMMACSIASMAKSVPLREWGEYVGKYGMPALLGSTSATRGSAEWDEMVRTVESLLTDLAVVTTSAESIRTIDLKGVGEAPFEPLVSRMDRMITVLWRGADLSTLSRDRGYGASLQEGETGILEEDDAEMITETLNRFVDRQVITQLFGPDAPQLANIKVLIAPRKATDQDLQIDKFLIEHGAQLSVSDALARYGRAPADPEEAFLTTLAPPLRQTPVQPSNNK